MQSFLAELLSFWYLGSENFRGKTVKKTAVLTFQLNILYTSRLNFSRPGLFWHIPTYRTLIDSYVIDFVCWLPKMVVQNREEVRFPLFSKSFIWETLGEDQKNN